MRGYQVDFLPSAQICTLCSSGEFTRERRCVTTTKYEAAQRLVTSFSAIPTEWVKIVAAQTGAAFYGIMWGTMFVVNDPVDKRRIQALLQPVEDEEDELYGSEEVGDTGISAFEGSVSKVEMVTPMALIYKMLFPSISTFETPPHQLAPDPAAL